jgi:hypothetical protein
MRRTALLVATLALPTLIAFANGGTSSSARAGFVPGACLLLAASALTSRAALLPPGTGGRLTLAALAGFAALTALSTTWTNDPGGWLVATQLSIGYGALFYAAVLQLTGQRQLRRHVEPLLALGTVAVVGYGVAQRALSDVLTADESVRAGGRLFTPIGYWNAEGLLAAIGVVLCASVFADRARPAALRVSALAAVPMLSVGVQLSFSRVAIAAVLGGLLLLALLSPFSTRFRTLGLVAVVGGLGVVTTLPFSSLRSAAVDASTGAPWLLLLLATSSAAAFLAWVSVNDREVTRQPPARPTRTALIALIVIILIVPFAAAIGSRSDEGSDAFGASTARLTATGSNRAQYWEVALDRFAARPLYGDGAGSFSSAWLEYRTINEKIVNAHSIWLETAAELGLAGLLLLAMVVAGVVLALRRSEDPPAVTGAAAMLLTWMLGASLDWHWQVPAVTAIAVLLAGLAVSAERPGSNVD